MINNQEKIVEIVLKFLETNSPFIEFLATMGVVGLALYIILKLIDKFNF